MGTGKGKAVKAERLARAERVAQMRREQAARDRRNRLIVWGTVVGVLVVMAASLGFAFRGSSSGPAKLSGVKTYKVSAAHVTTPVAYPQTPPAGGPHAPVWLNCATYDKAVPNENAVHALEHGAVWVTYRPNLPAKQVAELKKMLGNSYEVLSPYPGLPAPVVASAWGKQLRLQAAGDKRLEAFITKYRQGSQAPETGASCTGGTDGTPGSPGVPMPTSS